MDTTKEGSARLVGMLAIALVSAGACTTSSTGGGEERDEEEHEDEEHEHEEHERVAGAVRALIGDHEGLLRLHQLSDGEVVWTHTFDELDGDLSGLATTEDGRFAVINLRGAANRVAFLDSGVLAEDHGDHVHLEVEPPQLLDYHISGDEFGASRIAHIVSRDDRISAFFDGDANLTDSAHGITVPLSNLTAGSPAAAEVHVGNRHHGVAVPAEGGAVIMSVAESGAPGSTVRTGVRVYEGATELAGFPMSCDGLHGYAVIGEHYLFGCSNVQGGVLVVTHERDSGTWSEHQVEFSVGASNRISNFAAHPALPFALAPWGGDAFIRVDPDSARMSQDDVLELPAAQCGYALRQDTGEHLLVLTADGMLRSYRAADWSEGPTLDVVSEFQECPNPAPVLETVGSFAYVMDPESNVLLEIELADDELVIENSVGLEGEVRRMTLFYHPAALQDHDH